MMSLFSSDTSPAPTTPRRLARYGLYLVGAMVALWVVTRAAAMSPTESTSESPPESSSTDSTMVASTSSGEAPSIEIFTWGNLAAFLLLAGGGGGALYLHQQRTQTGSNTPFRSLGKMGLGASKHMRLVACGDEALLIGVTDDEITLLKTYPLDAFENLKDAETEDGNGSLPAEHPATPHGEWSESFADVLNRFADRTPYS